MKQFRLVVDQQELNLIVEHLNDGQYKKVAQLLSDLHAQVQKQLPKVKVKKETPAARKAQEIISHSNGHYAKGPG
jgi:hypothetical protein